MAREGVPQVMHREPLRQSLSAAGARHDLLQLRMGERRAILVTGNASTNVAMSLHEPGFCRATASTVLGVNALLMTVRRQVSQTG
jgi:hypothetical protein